jgi:electron transfer flavoprotein alpha subunit
MADRILVVAEQREGKLNRVSLETLAAAQAIGKETGWPVDFVLPGFQTAPLAQELAAFKVEKVYDLEGPSLEAYTSDAYVHALKAFVARLQPKLVLFPHTYQVRDFAPRMAMALDRTLISDATGYKYESGKLLFTRQMFQGKFVAEVAFAGDAPWLATLQIGTYRADQAEAGAAQVETVEASAPPALRITPHEVFQEAKQAVDLSQAGVSRNRRTWPSPKTWPRPWVVRWLLPAPSATMAGCRWTGKSAARGKPWPQSFTLR